MEQEEDWMILNDFFEQRTNDFQQNVYEKGNDIQKFWFSWRKNFESKD